MFLKQFQNFQTPVGGFPMKYRFLVVVVLSALSGPHAVKAEDRPYLTTQSPITLVSSNDGEITQLFQLTDDQIIIPGIPRFRGSGLSFSPGTTSIRRL